MQLFRTKNYQNYVFSELFKGIHTCTLWFLNARVLAAGALSCFCFLVQCPHRCSSLRWHAPSTVSISCILSKITCNVQDLKFASYFRTQQFCSKSLMRSLCTAAWSSWKFQNWAHVITYLFACRVRKYLEELMMILAARDSSLALPRAGIPLAWWSVS